MALNLYEEDVELARLGFLPDRPGLSGMGCGCSAQQQPGMAGMGAAYWGQRSPVSSVLGSSAAHAVPSGGSFFPSWLTQNPFTRFLAGARGFRGLGGLGAVPGGWVADHQAPNGQWVDASGMNAFGQHVDAGSNTASDVVSGITSGINAASSNPIVSSLAQVGIARLVPGAAVAPKPVPVASGPSIGTLAIGALVVGGLVVTAKHMGEAEGEAESEKAG